MQLRWSWNGLKVRLEADDCLSMECELPAFTDNRRSQLTAEILQEKVIWECLRDAWRAFESGSAPIYQGGYQKLFDLNSERVLACRSIMATCDQVYLGLDPNAVKLLRSLAPEIVAEFCLQLLAYRPEIPKKEPPKKPAEKPEEDDVKKEEEAASG